MGNQLFQYAFALALSKCVGLDNVRIDSKSWFKECLKNEFQGTKRIYTLNQYQITLKEFDISKNKCKQWFYIYNKNIVDKIITKILTKFFKNGIGKTHIYHLEAIQKYHSKLLERRTYIDQDMYYLHGYFQSYKYFESIRNLLLDEFHLRKTPDFSQYNFDDNTVALHARRGDYVKLGVTLDEKYYIKAIELMANMISDPIFYIFSDDLEWCKSLNFSYRHLFVNEDRIFQDYEELALMSRCKHFIISNSSYSWWGAWLSTHIDKKVICPMNWANSYGIELIPSTWIKI